VLNTTNTLTIDARWDHQFQFAIIAAMECKDVDHAQHVSDRPAKNALLATLDIAQLTGRWSMMAPAQRLLPLWQSLMPVAHWYSHMMTQDTSYSRAPSHPRSTLGCVTAHGSQYRN
jgi:hypothetical protein